MIERFESETDQYTASKAPRLTVPIVYERIKKSNSSLNRKSKRLLEDSIERVLDVRFQDAAEIGDNESEPAEEGAEEGIQSTGNTALNGINNDIVAAWSQKPGSSGPNGQLPTEAVSIDVPNPGQGKKRSIKGESFTRRKKVAVSVDRSAPTQVSLADLGGVDEVIQQLEDLIVLPLLQPDVYITSKIQPPRGILLHGPPGCGKTMIANAFAAELSVPFIAVSAPSIVSGMSGESEKALREHFEEAKKIAPCIIFIDEVDAITPKRESAQREMEKRIVAQLLTCMDSLSLDQTDGKSVIVLAATNRPDSLDPALRRGGRFDKEINMGVPSEAVRAQIIRALTRQMSIAPPLDYAKFAKMTPGFVGADLSDLVATAGSAAIKRLLQDFKLKDTGMDIDDPTNETTPQIAELRRLIRRARDTRPEEAVVRVTEEDFLTALPKIQPSSKREGFATIPDTTWSDIGALQSVREELATAVVEPIRNPEKYRRVGITAPAGVLLWGPPGCGKTLLAKAVANESKANFISVKGPELLNKYVGESERAVRQVFVRARSSVPCVIFFDELDALVPRRDDSLSESSARVVNTLLTELDGLGNREGIFVLAATNRPDIIDPAMLRPGRLETLLFVDLPGAPERAEILQTLCRHSARIDASALAEVARSCEGFSGADLGSLLRQAGYAAIRRDDEIKVQDFEAARIKVKPSVTNRAKYERLRRDWGAGS